MRKRDGDRHERIVARQEGDEDAGKAVADEERLGHPAFDAGADDEAARCPPARPRAAPTASVTGTSGMPTARAMRGLASTKRHVEAEAAASPSATTARSARTSASGSAMVRFSQPIAAAARPRRYCSELREAALRVLPGAVEQMEQEIERHVVEKQRGDDLVDPSLQRRRPGTAIHSHAAERGGDEHQRQPQRLRPEIV